jgi:hypothetical protein
VQFLFLFIAVKYVNARYISIISKDHKIMSPTRFQALLIFFHFYNNVLKAKLEMHGDKASFSKNSEHETR